MPCIAGEGADRPPVTISGQRHEIDERVEVHMRKRVPPSEIEKRRSRPQIAKIGDRRNLRPTAT